MWFPVHDFLYQAKLTHGRKGRESGCPCGEGGRDNPGRHVEQFSEHKEMVHVVMCMGHTNVSNCQNCSYFFYISVHINFICKIWPQVMVITQWGWATGQLPQDLI